MAEFAGLASDATGQVLGMLKDARESVENTFAGNKKLELKFPDSYAVTRYNPAWQQKYKFAWTEVETHTYQGVYYSHIRAARREAKLHELKTARKELKKAEGKNFSKVEKDVQAKVLANLTAKYEAKFDQARQKATVGGTFDTKRWTDFVEGRSRHFGIKISPTLSSRDAAALIAAQVKKSSKYKDKVESVLTREFEDRAVKALGKSTMDDAKAKDKLKKHTEADINSSALISTVVCYEVQYQIWQVDKDEAEKRFEKLLEQMKEKRRQEKAALRETLDKAIARLKEIDANPTRFKGGLSDTEKLLDKHSASVEKVRVAYRAKQHALLEAKTEAEKFYGEKVVGKCAVYSVNNCGEFESGIHYLNTNASLEAKVTDTLDGGFKISLHWWEQGKVGVPIIGDKLLAQDYSRDGSITIRPNAIAFDGKLGERFEQHMHAA